MSLSEWFSFNNPSTPSEELPDIFPVSITQTEFVTTNIVSIFSKILTDVLERTHGLSDDQMALMWDSCVKSNSSDGLVTLLAKAIADKQDLFIVYDKAIQVIRVATGPEQAQIRADYNKQSESSVGIFISFKNYTRSDLLKLYSGLEFLTVASLHKSMNLSKAVQIKISDMRKSVSLADSPAAKSQALLIAESLSKGKDVMLDAKDIIETAKPELEPVQKAIEFLAQKFSFYLGLPASYITGEQTGGLSTTGQGDTKAIDRGLKNYFFSIIKPTVKSLFGIDDVSFKPQDFSQISGASELLKTFSLTDEELISKENKTKIINSAFGLDDDSEGDPFSSSSGIPKAQAGKVVAAAPSTGLGK